MGGKRPPDPVIVEPPAHQSPELLLAPMQIMMQQLMQQNANNQQQFLQQYQESRDQQQRATNIERDWVAERDRIAKALERDVENRPKGRASTFLVSPLQEEEVNKYSQVLLNGKVSN